MKEIDISGISVRVWGARRHSWREGQTFHHDPARHDDPAMLYHLWLIREGCVQVDAGERHWEIEGGEACFLPVSLERHISTCAPAAWLSIGLRVAFYDRFDLLQNLQLPARWRPDEAERIILDSWMDHIVRVHRQTEAHQRLTVINLSGALLGVCWPHLSSQPLDSPQHPGLPLWLATVLRRISTEPSCSIGDLAHESGFSPAQFRRIFHKWIGISPRDYLKRRRMETARHLLETTDLALPAIAIHVGFHDASHFSELFKATYGVLPSHYRASHHAKDE